MCGLEGQDSWQGKGRKARMNMCCQTRGPKITRVDEEFQARGRMVGDNMREAAEVTSSRALQGIIRNLDLIVNLWGVIGAFIPGSAIFKCSH